VISIILEHKLHLHIAPSLIHISSEQSSEESLFLSSSHPTWFLVSLTHKLDQVCVVLIKFCRITYSPPLDALSWKTLTIHSPIATHSQRSLSLYVLCCSNFYPSLSILAHPTFPSSSSLTPTMVGFYSWSGAPRVVLPVSASPRAAAPPSARRRRWSLVGEVKPDHLGCLL
jgi:hypothetical protein